MAQQSYSHEGLTMAVTNMDEMVQFYSNVFSISFDKREVYGTVLYSGQWGNLRLLMCPAELAQVHVDRNRQQFDMVVEDIEEIMSICLANGGKELNAVQDQEEVITASIFDPDGNSIVFKQYK